LEYSVPCGLLQPYFFRSFTGIAGQENRPSSAPDVLHVDQDQRPRDTEPQRARLPGDPPP